MTAPQTLHGSIEEAMGEVLVGNEEIVESLSVALLTGGHILLEGVPGVAKTTMARLFAGASGLEVTRIQMTPDVLPADLTGTYVYREQTGDFHLRRGPVFSNVVIADEINRATPKTQSALLEAMQERQVTIDGETHPLPDPFIVVATQNPIEMEGTFELPVAQRDRFQQKRTVSIPERDVERRLLDRFDEDPHLGPDMVEAVVDESTIEDARQVVDTVYVADEIIEYVLDLVAATRESEDIQHGVSPRASIALLQAARARGAIAGRDYVIPDDVKALCHGVLAHRLVLTAEAELSDVEPGAIVDNLLEQVPAPPEEDARAAREDAAASEPTTND